MNLCSDGHDEICFDGRICPCCDKIEQAKQELAEKDLKIDQLQDEIRQSERPE